MATVALVQPECCQPCSLELVTGHLFIVDGDLTKIACDAWLLPTSRNATFRRWRSSLSPETQAILDAWKWDQGGDVQPLTETPPGGAPWIWLVNIAQPHKSVDWYTDQPVEFIKSVSGAIGNATSGGRLVPLLAVNLIGTGGGGKASEKGEVCQILIPKLRGAAERYGVDVVLVTRGQDAYSAAQRVRKDLVDGYQVDKQSNWEPSDTWKLGANSSELFKTAQDLATHVRNDELVLFLGAGVSAGSGVPGWQDLLEQIGTHAGLDAREFERIKSLDLRDQAALLERRLAKIGERLNDLVAKHTSAERFSLAHGLLASLQVREVVTTNYDTLFEKAVGDQDGGLAVLPGQTVAQGQRWLLKLHGSNEDAANLVLTREQYLELAKRRGALLGLLQAMLLTRKMLFVGYSLSDEDFHAVLNGRS
jgi:hypothetical protein